MKMKKNLLKMALLAFATFAASVASHKLTPVKSQQATGVKTRGWRVM